jgi:hypothetical protein
VQFNEGNHDMVDESKKETDNGNSSRKWGKVFSDKGAAAPKAEVAYQINAGSRKRKQKSLTLKVRTGYFQHSIVKLVVLTLYVFCLVFWLITSMKYLVCCRMMKHILVLI